MHVVVRIVQERKGVIEDVNETGALLQVVHPIRADILAEEAGYTTDQEVES
jgi:hypothetical protein